MAGPDPIDVELGSTVRRHRRERGLTQEGLANAIGLTFQQVQKYESGDNRISAATLCRIAAALSVPPGELLSAANAVAQPLRKPASLRGLDGLVADFQRIPSDEQRRAVRQLIRTMGSLESGVDDGASTTDEER